MSLTTSFINDCPLLMEGDVLSLSSSFRSRGCLLTDTRLGVDHQLQQPGDRLVAQLHGGILFDDLRRSTTLADDTQLRNLLGFLNIAGGLQRKRSIFGHIQASMQTLDGLSKGVCYTSLTTRRQASPWTLMAGLWHATWLVSSASVAIGVLAIAGNLLSTAPVIKLLLTSNGIFLLSVYAHELAHYATLQLLHVQSDIIQRGLRLGLLHRPLTNKHEIVSAIVGPSCGMACCTVFGLIGGITHSLATVVVTMCVSALHLSSFLPWYGDGASLRRALTKWSQV